MDIMRGFVAGQDDIFDLLRRARRVGITIAPNGLIYIVRANWTAGKPIRVRFVFRTYKEAIRSHTHSLDSIFGRSEADRDLRAEFERMHQWLLSARVSPREKQSLAEKRLCEMVERLTGVRCPNRRQLLFELKGDESLISSSVAELLKGKYWGACCCKIVSRLKPLAIAERQRVLAQGPRVFYKRQLLQKIWEYDQAEAARWLVSLNKFAQSYAMSRVLIPATKDEKRIEWLFECLGKSYWMLFAETGRQFYNRLKFARRKIEELGGLLEKRCLNESSDEALERARGAVRSHISWLQKVDSADRQKRVGVKA